MGNPTSCWQLVLIPGVYHSQTCAGYVLLPSTGESNSHQAARGPTLLTPHLLGGPGQGQAPHAGPALSARSPVLPVTDAAAGHGSLGSLDTVPGHGDSGFSPTQPGLETPVSRLCPGGQGAAPARQREEPAPPQRRHSCGWSQAEAFNAVLALTGEVLKTAEVGGCVGPPQGEAGILGLLPGKATWLACPRYQGQFTQPGHPQAWLPQPSATASSAGAAGWHPGPGHPPWPQ